MKVFREKWLVYAQNRKIESVLNLILGIIDNICISETYLLCFYFFMYLVCTQGNKLVLYSLSLHLLITIDLM